MSSVGQLSVVLGRHWLWRSACARGHDGWRRAWPSSDTAPSLSWHCREHTTRAVMRWRLINGSHVSTSTSTAKMSPFGTSLSTVSGTTFFVYFIYHKKCNRLTPFFADSSTSASPMTRRVEQTEIAFLSPMASFACTSHWQTSSSRCSLLCSPPHRKSSSSTFTASRRVSKSGNPRWTSVMRPSNASSSTTSPPSSSP